MTDTSSAPVVTVLVTTFNRASLLRRALSSVLQQDFADLEIVVIDDCSSDNTPEVVASFGDPRIRYVRNEVNQGKVHGDRAHVRRCIYELMRGRYFVYLCDDDFWLPKTLLSRQVAAFRRYPTLSMALGSHAHTYPVPWEQLLERSQPKFEIVSAVSPSTYFPRGVLPEGFIPRHQFLDLFAEAPTLRNILDGATLFSREALQKAKVFHSEKGSRWQAGYEFKIGPASVGDVFFIDEPCVIAAVEQENASFRGTQLQHYRDCLDSINIACSNVRPALSPQDQALLDQFQRKIIHRLSVSYLSAQLSFKGGGFDENPVNHDRMFTGNVTPEVVKQVFAERGIALTPGVRVLMAATRLPRFVLRAALWTLDRVPIRQGILRRLREPPVSLRDSA